MGADRLLGLDRVQLVPAIVGRLDGHARRDAVQPLREVPVEPSEQLLIAGSRIVRRMNASMKIALAGPMPTSLTTRFARGRTR